jgi:hypothetical protein
MGKTGTGTILLTQFSKYSNIFHNNIFPSGTDNFGMLICSPAAIHLNTKSLLAGSYSSIDLIYSSEIIKRKCNVQSLSSYTNLGCKLESNLCLTFYQPVVTLICREGREC